MKHTHPLIDDQAKCNMQYYPVLKKKEIQIHATSEMSLEDIMLDKKKDNTKRINNAWSLRRLGKQMVEWSWLGTEG